MRCASGSIPIAWPPAVSPPLDVTNALAEQNVEVAAGQLGQPPSDAKQDFQMVVRVVGRLTDPRQFENLVLKNSTNANGIVLLRDVGRAEVGAETYATSLKFSGGDGSRRRCSATL